MTLTPQAEFYLEILRRLVSLPTTSFHEEGVCAEIIAFLEKYKLNYQIDPYGNIIAHYHKGAPCRPLALMAHTDHPAFELETPASVPEFPEANWIARLVGGVRMDWFQAPQGVVAFAGNDTGRQIAGTLLGGKMLNGPREVQLYLKLEGEGLEPGNFGIWDLPDFELRDGFIHARVLDDLVGCAAGLLALWKLAQDEAETDVYAVFTRAEEVGLVGAELVFQQKLLPPETFVVSLEASKTLPGALQGEGPVIRVGDRAFTFSEEAEFVLKKAAERLQDAAEEAVVKVQRQLMSGGRCEASTAILQGYTATGLAFPLGNYHNMGDDFRLQTENIHQQDFLTGVELLQEAARLMPYLPKLEAARLEAEATPPALIERLLATRSKIAPA